MTRWSGTERPVDESHEDVPLPSPARTAVRLTRRGRAVAAASVTAAAVGGVALLGSLTGGLSGVQDPAQAAAPPTAAPAPVRPAWAPPVLASPPRAFELAPDPHVAAVTAARAVLDASPLVVVVPEPTGGVTDSHRLARWLAVRLRAPLLYPGADLATFVDRAGTRTAVTVGLGAEESRLVREVVADVRAAHTATSEPAFVPGELEERPDRADPAARDAVGDPLALRTTSGPPLDAWLGEVRPLLRAAGEHRAGAAPTYGVLLRAGDPSSWAIATTAAVAGLRSAVTTSADPRADATVVERLGGTPRALPAGTREAWADVDPDALLSQLDVVAEGHVLPNGRQTLFPGTALVALYGNPEGGALGVLGEQPVAAAIERARAVAEPYAALAAAEGVTVVPTFEIIATVASAGPGARGDHSRRTPIELLRPWVDAAAEAGVYVILDLQPGRTSFVDQAMEYEELLREPHVGLALDPEWRLGPNQVHLRQIGSVAAAEVNAVADWLAGLVRAHRLPQKAFVVHQFKRSMIRDRAALALGHPELAPIIHVDGQGGQAAKDVTYRNVVRDAPASVWWGWKNFYDEDVPSIRSPEATWAVEPRPVMISYQ